MIACKLHDKEYFIDFVSGRALREMQPALEAYAHIKAAIMAADRGEPIPETMTVQEAYDTMVAWFCLAFRNQFTPEDMYDNYPVDAFMPDMIVLLNAVTTAQTAALSVFPTTAAEKEKP